MEGLREWVVILADTLSLYVNIVPDLLEQGFAGLIPVHERLPGKGFVLHTARPVRKERSSLAAFLGQSMIGGTRFECPLYKDPTPPGISAERKHEYVVHWTGLGRYAP